MRRTPKILIAIGLAVGLAPLAVAIVADHPADKPEGLSTSGTNPSSSEIDRTEELRACRDKGAAALEHPPCLRIWSEQRDRFLGVTDNEVRSEKDDSLPPSNRPDGLRAPKGQD
ncbi:putative entry exclusion protein TrbK-alt [Jannaschia rubra]|uniref:putative entry exclusion protein TrbK-alt n=1 Tax=Jannaschia rubra TaxID=282197 RepID=UPI002490BFBE|nr:putative entry exclusion protein TrbK-alt [Jannaschia rubra]